MMLKQKITVLGSGSWGTALAVMLAKKGYEVYLWSWFEKESHEIRESRENEAFLPGVIIPDNVKCIWDLEKCTHDAAVVVNAVPSHAVRAMAKKVKPYIQQGQIMVNVSKGLEQDTLLRLSEIMLQEIPHADIAVLSGPSHAEEVAKNIPTTMVAGAMQREIAEKVQDIFMTPTFRVYTNPDIAGVELGGALKNVIALCAGITDGLGFGDNTKAALMTRGITEIARLGVACGAKLHTFAGLSGIGDLIVTCTSMHSRNRRAGILIGQGKTVKQALEEVHMVVEGVNTAKAGHQLSVKYGIEMPIVSEAYSVLFENKNPKNAVMDLMMRSKTHEMEEIVAQEHKW